MAGVSEPTTSNGLVENGTKPQPSPTKLEDRAATAALYVTRYDKSNKTGREFLDKDQKLSSAGAAASLKYANPRDLPSFPTTGLKKNDTSAASAAASLGWANQKHFEHWKPDPSASASAAAMHAKDYKMAPLWQPEQSANGAKAALLASRDGGKVEIWKPETDPAWGNSAATQAFKKYGAGTLSPVLDYGYTDLGRKGSLMAATGAMSNGRRRAQSIPVTVAKPETYPDESNATTNALRAATSAHKSGKRSDNLDTIGGSTPYTNMSREMYTSHPPVAPEVEEKNRADVLHASAVAMAQGMYQRQSQTTSTSHAGNGARAAHGRHASLSSVSTDEATPMRFNNLQEAAHKLAQERLAKLHDEHAKNREYRDYYGGQEAPSTSVYKANNRLSFRGRVRRRASSDGDLDSDTAQANKIRGQMSIFSNNLSQVDEKKRAKDRENLIAAAQRNVTKSLHGMDERVFAETGKVAPSLLSEWEVKAHAAAQKNSDTRMENHGMIHIGGGKFVNQSEIDAVATRNVQPVLDEINEKAAAERERQAALKLDQENAAKKEADKKAREKETKAINKKLKQQDKDEERLRKADEKTERKEKERVAKEQGTSTTAKPESAVVAPSTNVEPEPPVASGAVPVPDEEEESTTVVAPAVREHATETPETRETPSQFAITAPAASGQAGTQAKEIVDGISSDLNRPTSPKSDRNVKNWLKTKFSRRTSKASKASTEKEPSSVDKGKGKEEGFVGGAALTGASRNNSTTSLGHNSESIRDVALAQTVSSSKAVDATTAVAPVAAETAAPRPPTPTRTTIIYIPSTPENKRKDIPEPGSPISPEEAGGIHCGATDSENEGEDSAARRGRAPARATAAAEAASPVSTFSKQLSVDDDYQEARDNFDQDLIPPPTFPAEKSASPVRDSKFKEVI